MRHARPLGIGSAQALPPLDRALLRATHPALEMAATPLEQVQLVLASGAPLPPLVGCTAPVLQLGDRDPAGLLGLTLGHDLIRAGRFERVLTLCRGDEGIGVLLLGPAAQPFLLGGHVGGASDGAIAAVSAALAHARAMPREVSVLLAEPDQAAQLAQQLDIPVVVQGRGSLAERLHQGILAGQLRLGQLVLACLGEGEQAAAVVLRWHPTGKATRWGGGAPLPLLM